MMINLPALVNDCFEALIPITTFDPVPELILSWIYNNMFGFEETVKAPSNLFIGAVGYESRNSVEGMGGAFITIVLFAGAKLIHVLVLKLPARHMTPGEM